jgi:hypothetical protein
MDLRPPAPLIHRKNGEAMGNHHTTILSMLPPWVGIVIGHISNDLTISNLASFASIAYCVVGVWVMLRRRKHEED